LIISTSVNPSQGINDFGLEIIRKSKGDTSFIQSNAFFYVLAAVGAGVAAFFIANKGYLKMAAKNAK
jgi:hypothetical protein